MNFKYKNALQLSKYILQDKIIKGDTVVDATCGNGGDSLFLCNLIGSSGKLYCFDIQSQAIENTRKKLWKNGVPPVYTLINDGHENIDKYIGYGIHGAVFNLGYLPKGDHNIITRPENTISAIKKIMDRLFGGGVIVIVVYWGHEGGAFEKETLLNYIKDIDSKTYTVIKAEFTNQENCPPMVIVIEKSADSSCEDI
jgi:Predicted S-adenosylmethionine-dependent methyltransferase involved in cell envelope biogenesis